MLCRPYGILLLTDMVLSVPTCMPSDITTTGLEVGHRSNMHATHTVGTRANTLVCGLHAYTSNIKHSHQMTLNFGLQLSMSVLCDCVHWLLSVLLCAARMQRVTRAARAPPLPGRNASDLAPPFQLVYALGPFCVATDVHTNANMCFPGGVLQVGLTGEATT